MIASVTVLPLSAVAATFTVTLEKQIIRGEAGQRVVLGTFDTPGDLVGQVCSVTATGNNNTSVHVGNDVEVTSANTVTLVGVEDAPNKTTVANGNLSLGEQISFTLVLGPDPVYSAELDVTLNCQPEATTTTTSTTTSSTTTTAPTTTTTVADTTTSSTTTTIAPETTSTSIANTTTSTTTATDVSPTTTVAPTTTSQTSDTLPFTGVSSDDLARIAYIGLAAGVGLVLLTRRSEERS
ncbi:MAG TPA: hypothetical protein VHL52_12640 [Acidimicrobiia bacterium]|nr:hypothetical protein [Acidimicrobiia bacterium]